MDDTCVSNPREVAFSEEVQMSGSIHQSGGKYGWREMRVALSRCKSAEKKNASPSDVRTAAAQIGSNASIHVMPIT